MPAIGALWRWFWSRETLLSGWLLHTLIVGVGLGTVYGYYWYWAQLVDTYHHMSPWLLPFVPDSPTASLFFVFSILALAWDRHRGRLAPLLAGGDRKVSFLRGFIEAFTLVTMVKYGIWAVVIIYWSYCLGEPFRWEHGMLTASHLAMVLAACVYGTFFRFRLIHLACVALWTVVNDVIDYGLGVFPRLSSYLHPHLAYVEAYTYSMSLLCVLLAFVYLLMRQRNIHNP